MVAYSAVLALATLPAFRATNVLESDAARANPIRKVVTMLQSMQKKVEAEGKTDEALFQKFSCYCKNSEGELTASITAADSKSVAVAADIEEGTNAKTQLDAELKAHKADRDEAKQSVAQATAIRSKEAKAFSASSTELNSNIGAIKSAVASLEKGMAGGFLQTSNAQVVKNLVENSEKILDVDREAVMAFLAGGRSGYTPQSGGITGILKQIGDEMSASLADETAAEASAVKDHNGLLAAKAKEIAAHTKAIEEKTVRAGEVAVNIVNMKNDLTDTQEALVADKAFVKELEEGCSNKEAEYTEGQKTRSAELVALAETIKFLNDDDALELFKKAIPSASASFVQLGGSTSGVRARALADVRAARAHGQQRPGLDLIALALQGKTTGFEKVVAMIDEMTNLLKKEQQDDDNKKDYCAVQLDQADDKKKGLEASASNAATAAENADNAIATLTEELKALAAGIADLDKSVAEASEQRKEEHAAFTDMMAVNTQAKEILGVAKNRLNKFYNPKLYVAPPKKEFDTREGRISANFGGASFAQVSAHSTHRAAPPPPPDTAEAYGKKSQESNGVIAMIDLLVQDIDKQMTEGETSEKDSQHDYETMLADAKDKRAADSKSVAEKESAKADSEEEAQSHKDSNAAATKELMATSEYIHGLHSECDWLVENYDNRKTARAGEVDSLKNAKAVLAGADYSLVQMRRATNPTCPQTKMDYSVAADAGGNDIWQDCQYNGQQNECHNIGVGAVKKLKFCGPGELTISRMTCNNHDYKAQTIVHKKTEYTTQCEEIDMAPTIAGPVGDAPAYWGSFTLKSC